MDQTSFANNYITREGFDNKGKPYLYLVTLKPKRSKNKYGIILNDIQYLSFEDHLTEEDREKILNSDYTYFYHQILPITNLHKTIIDQFIK